MTYNDEQELLMNELRHFDGSICTDEELKFANKNGLVNRKWTTMSDAELIEASNEPPPNSIYVKIEKWFQEVRRQSEGR